MGLRISVGLVGLWSLNCSTTTLSFVFVSIWWSACNTSSSDYWLVQLKHLWITSINSTATHSFHLHCSIVICETQNTLLQPWLGHWVGQVTDYTVLPVRLIIFVGSRSFAWYTTFLDDHQSWSSKMYCTDLHLFLNLQLFFHFFFF